jgi:hypothetical protein
MGVAIKVCVVEQQGPYRHSRKELCEAKYETVQEATGSW